MKILFLLCVFVIGVLSQNIVWRGNYDSLPELPGLDFLGFGYDARFADIQDALQIPLMDYTFSSKKAYFYPANRTTVFKVPDQVIVRTIAYTEATATLYNSVDEVIEKMTSDSGIDFENEVVLSNTTLDCTNTTNTADNTTTETCNVTSNFTNTQLFKVGAQINYVKESFSRAEQYLVENAETTQLYAVTLDSRFLRNDLKDAVTALTPKIFNLRAITKFLETYGTIYFVRKVDFPGTHYVVSAVLGGKVAMETSIDKSATSVSETTTNSETQVSRQEALAGATSTFQGAISGSSDFSLANSAQKTQFSQTSNWKLSGGDSNLVNLLDTRESADAVKLWKPSIIYNPVPVQYRLRSVATLFEDPIARERMKDAIKLYLNFPTDDIRRIGFDLSTGTWKIVSPY